MERLLTNTQTLQTMLNRVMDIDVEKSEDKSLQFLLAGLSSTKVRKPYNQLTVKEQDEARRLIADILLLREGVDIKNNQAAAKKASSKSIEDSDSEEEFA